MSVSRANTTLERTRILLFVAFAFGIAWAVGAVVYVTGGLANSPRIVPSLPITLATVIIATGYMFSPALANLFTRVSPGEG